MSWDLRSTRSTTSRTTTTTMSSAPPRRPSRPCRWISSPTRGASSSAAWSTNPRTFAIEDLLKMFPQEDRIYRLRCVEAWSMVIPWQGFPLASLLKAVEPTSDAKYVRIHHLDGQEATPRRGQRFLSLALYGGVAAGRGHERSGAAGHGFVRRSAARAGRRPHPPGRAVEVRIQRHQGHRQDRAWWPIGPRPSGRPSPRTSTASTPM